MKNLKITMFLAFALMGLLAACGGDNDPEIEQSSLLQADEAYTYSFDTEETEFETGSFGTSQLSVTDGRYLVTSHSERGNHYLVGANNNLELKNVAVRVDATPINGDENNWYGVVCRTHGNDIGYAALISSDGFWSIARISESNGRQWLEYLTDWQENDNINRDNSNQLLVYCVDDYIALYVNDKFLGDHRDGDYDLSGGVGFLAGGAENDTVTVAFDNVEVRPAHQSGRENTATPTASVTEEPTAIVVPPLGSSNDNGSASETSSSAN